MSSYPALDGLRIGCLQYLNARPLIDGYEGAVTFDHPAVLAERLASGHLDLGLVPTFELLVNPHYSVIDDVSISAEGPVFSVYIAYKGEFAAIRQIELDPASLTSVHLAKCLLAEFHGLHPAYRQFQGTEASGGARLLIGNQAIAFRQQHGAEFSYFDLAAEWTRCTSLPFVFALWLLRRDAPNQSDIARSVRRLKDQGMARLETIISTESERDPDFCRQYFTSYIRYGLGEREKEGLELFARLLRKHKLLPLATASWEYI